MIRDTFARPLRNLRLSVTDRCNLRCAYCMPEEEYAWLPRADILTFEEIARLVDVFAANANVSCTAALTAAKTSPRVARANGLNGFRQLPPGTRVIFPPLEK